jgi:hypothetical protein
VNQYFANTNAARQAMDTGGTTRDWWLRSPGGSSADPVAIVGSSGAFSCNDATGQGYGLGFRPALWIRL